MIISKAAVLAVSLFCPSNAHDISKHGSFLRSSSSSSESKNKTNKTEEVASTGSPPLTLSLSPEEEKTLSHGPYDEIGVLKNKAKPLIVEPSAVLGEGQGDDIFATGEDKLDIEPDAHAVINQEVYQQDSAATRRMAQEDDKYEDANVGILSFKHGIDQDNYHYVDNEDASHRRLDLTNTCTNCCIGGCDTACKYAGGGAGGGQATIGNGSCNSGLCIATQDIGLACSSAGYNGMATIGDEACTADLSCQSLGGGQGKACIGNKSCTGILSCNSAGVDQGQATIGMGSCTEFRSCEHIGRGELGVVDVGDGSCTGEKSCVTYAGYAGTSFFTIGNNSCTCEKCCYKLRNGSYIGDGQCTSLDDGCSEQDGPVDTRGGGAPSKSSEPSIVPTSNPSGSPIPTGSPSSEPSSMSSVFLFVLNVPSILASCLVCLLIWRMKMTRRRMKEDRIA